MTTLAGALAEPVEPAAPLQMILCHRKEPGLLETALLNPSLTAAIVEASVPSLPGAVLEIVIDGLTADDINQAMRVGIHAACELGAKNGIKRISAGNYGGKLGQFHFKLREIMA